MRRTRLKSCSAFKQQLKASDKRTLQLTRPNLLQKSRSGALPMIPLIIDFGIFWMFCIVQSGCWPDIPTQCIFVYMSLVVRSAR